MFGKVFEQMYTGSMVGAGTNVYSLWPYMIACCDSDGDVDVHPVAVAAILGGKVDEIKSALEYLLAPDENSRSEEHNGARIVKVLENRYHLVNYEKYRAIRDQDVRREQIREAQRRFRAKKGLSPVISNHDVSHGNPEVIHGNPDVSHCKPRAESREKRESKSENGERPPRFSPPTVQEVEAFILEKGYTVSAQKFVSFYESKGWMVGKTKMVSWKAAVSGWQKTDDERRAGKAGSAPLLSPEENARRAKAAREMV